MSDEKSQQLIAELKAGGILCHLSPNSGSWTFARVLTAVDPSVGEILFQNRRIRVVTTHDPSVPPVIGDVARLRREDEGWGFQNTIMADFGGLDQDWINWTFPTFDAAAEFVNSYYLGTPTLIDGWLIPIHCRTFLWNPLEVEAAIKNARQASADEWDKQFRDDHLALVRATGGIERCWYTVSRSDGLDLHLRFDARLALLSRNNVDDGDSR